MPSDLTAYPVHPPALYPSVTFSYAASSPLPAGNLYGITGVRSHTRVQDALWVMPGNRKWIATALVVGLLLVHLLPGPRHELGLSAHISSPALNVPAQCYPTDMSAASQGEGS